MSITEADIQYLLSLDEEIVGPILNYDNLSIVNELTEPHQTAVQTMHQNIDRYVKQFTKIPDARFELTINLYSEKYNQHEIEAHHVLWSNEDKLYPGGSICYECMESCRVANKKESN